MKYLGGLFNTDDWDKVDAIIFWGVWLAMLYFGATQSPCTRAHECGAFDMWFFGVISASLILAAIFLTHVDSIFTPKNKR